MVNRDDFDDDFDDPDAFDYKPVSSDEEGGSKWFKIVIALSVVGAMGAGAWYFVSAPSMNDSDIPVVRAPSAPIKERPNEPGGMDVPNRDKTVYNRLSGDEGTPKVERLLPPPEQPLEKPVVGTESALPELSETTSQQTGMPAISKALPEQVNEPVEVETAQEPQEVEAPTENTTQLPEVPTAEMAAATEEPAAVIMTDPNAPRALVKRSDDQNTVSAEDKEGLEAKIAEALAETINEQAQGTQSSPSPTQASIASSSEEISTTSVAEKGYMLQLLSSKNEAGVKREWDKIKSRNADVIAQTPARIVRADLGADKGIYYRLRLGPLGGNEQAKDLCNKLKDRDVGCFIVRVQ